MSQRHRISKEELLGVKVHRPYACKTTYHYNHGIYETEGHCVFQPLNCAERLGSLYFRCLKHILMNNAFTEDIYGQQFNSINDYIRLVTYKYTVHIYEGRKPPYKCMTLEIEWRVGVNIQTFMDE